VVTAGIDRAPSIKVAEAAKVIENTQRDLVGLVPYLPDILIYKYSCPNKLSQ
jgi:UDP-N-acetyl-D-mannosaminuronate dehydrogenase